MRSHIQGLFLLLLVGIALLGIARYAAPVVQEALGEDGALQAESAPEDPSDLGAIDVEVDPPLNGDEVGIVQDHLTRLGFDPGPVDGLMGPSTRTAIDEAIVEYQLNIGSSDRNLLNYTQSLIDALDAAAAASEEELGTTESG
ncbi:peptidoglycan-binding protein [Acidimicrobiales bacterium]|jgi:peptidoglycan hydrolase-like protein with peptidoglycan-binding domain|nr:peptidoglycan-binding protein [Acidimicrobiales bacterium]